MWKKLPKSHFFIKEELSAPGGTDYSAPLDCSILVTVPFCQILSPVLIHSHFHFLVPSSIIPFSIAGCEIRIIEEMPPKLDKQPFNPMAYPQVDLDHLALVDKDYKIHETKLDSDLFHVYWWFEDKFLEGDDEISLWETQLPLYIFPKTHSCPNLTRKFWICYDIK